jgi:hypothetical protein
MKNVVIFTTFLFAFLAADAQVADTSAAAVDTTDTPYMTKQFVIVQSTKNYPQALATAKTAAAKLKLKLDLRGLKPAQKIGLTFSKKECDEYYGYPCYIARGRYDDGVYVSIEYSNQYEGFKEGYYIVVVASGGEGSTLVAGTLKKAKTVFADAYMKKSQVYVGCIH